MTKNMWIGVAVAGFLVLVAAVMLLRPGGTIEPVTTPMPASGSVSPFLPGYAEAALQSCVQKAGSNPALTQAGVSSASIDAYCRCFATKSSELITAADAAYIEANKTLPTDFQAKVAPAMNSCAAENGLSVRP